MEDIQTIARGDSSRILRLRRVVARDDEEWRVLWRAHAGAAADAPPVDFATRMVVGVFQGQRPSAGFDSAIVGAGVQGAALTVEVEERLPATGRMGAQVLVSPFHIVSLPRFAGEVRFVDTSPHASEVTQATAIAPGTVAVATTPRPHPVAPSARAETGSSTGLAPETAGALAYLAGPLSGALLLIVERTSRSVRFHAWQALVGLGSLGLAALVCLGLAFAMLIISPRVFSAMLWMAAIAAGSWLALWAICLVQAYKGRQWKMPLVGARARRWAGL